MKQLKKALEWKKIIIAMLNDFYVNYMGNIGKNYSIPKSVQEFYDKNDKFKDIKSIENYVELLEEVKHEWKTFGSPNEMIPVYYQLVFINTANVINSIKLNLKKDEITTDKIENSKGIDILATTGMHVLATVLNEISSKYANLEMDQDKAEVFKGPQNTVNSILRQNTDDAFAKLIENMMNFNNVYRQIEANLTQLGHSSDVQDEFEGKRTQLFISYTNGYIINSMFLSLLLIYPFENGMMPEDVYMKLKPSINIF